MSETGERKKPRLATDIALCLLFASPVIYTILRYDGSVKYVFGINAPFALLYGMFCPCMYGLSWIMLSYVKIMKESRANLIMVIALLSLGFLLLVSFTFTSLLTAVNR